MDGASQAHAVLSTHSAEETRALGKRLGSLLQPGDFIGLIGDLGAGKTELIRGVAEGAAVPSEDVTSPSFALINVYEGRIRLYHADLYRLTSAEQLHAIGWDDVLESEGAVVVEWIDRVPQAAPKEGLMIHMGDGGGSVREVRVFPRGTRALQLANSLSGP
jgi:tRNA threonylcarbamoyladenosine biosynthesis protein TsaE